MGVVSMYTLNTAPPGQQVFRSADGEWRMEWDDGEEYAAPSLDALLDNVLISRGFKGLEPLSQPGIAQAGSEVGIESGSQAMAQAGG